MTTDIVPNRPLNSHKPSKGRAPQSLANLVIGRAKLAEKRRNGEFSNPAGYSVTAEVKQLLKNRARRLRVAEALVQTATLPNSRGYATALTQLLDRTEGKVKEQVQVEGNVTLMFVPARPRIEEEP